MKDIILTTARLMLRPFDEESDWQAAREYASDPEVTRYLGWELRTQEQELREFVRNRLRPVPIGVDEKGACFAVVLKAEKRLIGECCIGTFSPRDRQGFIAYAFSRACWGKGYATEAASAVLDYGFSRLGYHKISAMCAVENAASARVLEKLGMKLEGRFREDKLIGDKWHDMFAYAILEGEWKARVL
ncbi:MAG: GNAT family N-acetyltransferase [Chloroflexi bacterium]|nr:GNAT family N-acetyltransferase [Chloroflexota bacterium]